MAIDIEKKKIRDRAYSKIYYQKHKEREKLYSRRLDISKTMKKHGLAMDDYDKMLKEQKCCCAICGRHKITLTLRMAIDHCHTTGKVRGLLCRDCNVGIGTLKDSVELLKKAIEYLEKD